MMELEHFSHPHKLIYEKILYEIDEECKKITCEACQEHIPSFDFDEEEEETHYYSCKKCNFFLHKTCANRPMKLTNPQHPHHHLSLYSKEQFKNDIVSCNGCQNRIHGFIYHCNPCEFDLDFACAFPKPHQYFPDIHPHPLKFEPRNATFWCDICAVAKMDQSYRCSTCRFWIHKSCALGSLSREDKDHKHLLWLVEGFPDEYRVYQFVCDVCEDKLHPAQWVACCLPCRYFIHPSCIKVQTYDTSFTDQDVAYLSDSNFEENLLMKILLDDNLVHFPSENITIKLIQRFLLRKNSLANPCLEIQHFSHKQHTMFLFQTLVVNNNQFFQDEDEAILCDACVEPIAPPYYRCSICQYYLHLQCSKLPTTLKHPCHPHDLCLFSARNLYHLSSCNNCSLQTNGFYYGCEQCGFKLDLKCAILPSVVEHQKHNHPLFQEKSKGDEKCNICGENGSKDYYILRCNSCNFNLHYLCAMLPLTFRHRWDREHPIVFRFPPHDEHPDHIMCDFCETIIYPKTQLYSCFKCKICFHLKCPSMVNRFPNIKFGGHVEISSHPHPLKFLREASLKTSCDYCGDGIRDSFVFECQTCYLCLCYSCVVDQVTYSCNVIDQI